MGEQKTSEYLRTLRDTRLASLRTPLLNVPIGAGYMTPDDRFGFPGPDEPGDIGKALYQRAVTVCPVDRPSTIYLFLF